MTYRCPIHGLRLCALVSPDAIEIREPDEPSSLLVVKLILDGRLDHAVFVSRQFAERHGVVGDTLDYEKVFVESEWYLQLTAMCHMCFSARWPELVKRLREWVESGEPRPRGSV